MVRFISTFDVIPQSQTCTQGSKKRLSGRLGQVQCKFPCWGSNFQSLHVQWARGQAGHSLKKIIN